MQVGEMYVLAMLLVCAAGCYGVGKMSGFREGKAERNDTGWEDEARWWRRNSTGLRFVGIERERAYFDIACRRIEQAQAQGRLLPPETAPELAAVQQGFDL